jgi:hypothetical protein
MSKLFGRTWRVTVGTLRVDVPMRVAFEVERSVRSTPNKATVQIWNLTRDHQAQIEQAADAQVIVEAGYVSDRGLETIFSGELWRARGSSSGPTGIRTERSGAVDAITHVEARDAGVAYQQARVERSFAAGVSVATVLRACADALGVGSGNLGDVADLAQLDAGGTTYPEGTVLSGQAARELTRILDPLGLRWSVQSGALQVLRRGQSLRSQAVRLTPETGLVGVPEVGTRGAVKAVSLLTPDLCPGRPVLLESARVSGRYLVRSVTYRGDSHGQDWYAECDLAPEAA